MIFAQLRYTLRGNSCLRLEHGTFIENSCASLTTIMPHAKRRRAESKLRSNNIMPPNSLTAQRFTCAKEFLRYGIPTHPACLAFVDVIASIVRGLILLACVIRDGVVGGVLICACVRSSVARSGNISSAVQDHLRRYHAAGCGWDGKAIAVKMESFRPRPQAYAISA